MSQSLGRALDILNELDGEPKSLDALAGVVDVHKSTVLRLLRTLESQRFVTHDAAHRYRLGSRLFELSNRALAQRDVRTVARPHLERLNAVTGQTVHLAAYESGEVVYIDKLDALRGVRMYSRVGLRAPLHCTAVAKVLLAALPPAVAGELIARIDYIPMTPRTIRSATELAGELDAVRGQGYAEDNEEHESFINCVAAPIRDGTGTVIAALSISVPTMALSHARVVELVPQAQAAASAIAADLGWQPQPPQIPTGGVPI